MTMRTSLITATAFLTGLAQGWRQDQLCYSSGKWDQLQCRDGSFCTITETDTDCCYYRGGRAHCPDSLPYMCRSMTCGGGNDYCCARTSCRLYGGVLRADYGECPQVSYGPPVDHAHNIVMFSNGNAVGGAEGGPNLGALQEASNLELGAQHGKKCKYHDDCKSPCLLQGSSVFGCVKGWCSCGKVPHHEKACSYNYDCYDKSKCPAGGGLCQRGKCQCHPSKPDLSCSYNYDCYKGSKCPAGGGLCQGGKCQCHPSDKKCSTPEDCKTQCLGKGAYAYGCIKGSCSCDMPPPADKKCSKTEDCKSQCLGKGAFAYGCIKGKCSCDMPSLGSAPELGFRQRCSHPELDGKVCYDYAKKGVCRNGGCDTSSAMYHGACENDNMEPCYLAKCGNLENAFNAWCWKGDCVCKPPSANLGSAPELGFRPRCSHPEFDGKVCYDYAKKGVCRNGGCDTSSGEGARAQAMAMYPCLARRRAALGPRRTPVGTRIATAEEGNVAETRDE